MSAYTFTAPLHHASPKVHTDMLSALRTLLPRSKKPKYHSEEDEELEREKEEMRRWLVLLLSCQESMLICLMQLDAG